MTKPKPWFRSHVFYFTLLIFCTSSKWGDTQRDNAVRYIWTEMAFLIECVNVTCSHVLMPTTCFISLSLFARRVQYQPTDSASRSIASSFSPFLTRSLWILWQNKNSSRVCVWRWLLSFFTALQWLWMRLLLMLLLLLPFFDIVSIIPYSVHCSCSRSVNFQFTIFSFVPFVRRCRLRLERQWWWRCLHSFQLYWLFQLRCDLSYTFSKKKKWKQRAVCCVYLLCSTSDTCMHARLMCAVYSFATGWLNEWASNVKT